MHELGILRHMIKIVGNKAELNKIESVRHILLEVGRDSGVVPYYMNKLFPVAADKVPFLKNAELRIHMVSRNGCPVEALSMGENGKIRIDTEHCVGCGICRSRCAFDAIHIRQTMPVRKDLQEYFLKDYGLDLILEEKKR